MTDEEQFEELRRCVEECLRGHRANVIVDRAELSHGLNVAVTLVVGSSASPEAINALQLRLQQFLCLVPNHWVWGITVVQKSQFRKEI